MKRLLIAIGMVLLTGCANTMSAEQRLQLQSQRTTSASQPVLTLECSSGCQFDKLQLRDPNAVASLPALRTPTNGWDFANKALGTATAITPWLGITHLGVEAINSLEDQQNNTTIERGDTAGGDIVGGNVRGDTRGDVSGDVRGDTRGDVAGDTRGDVSGDVRGDTRGDTAGRDQIGRDRSTSDPTVVDQPAPVVVQPTQGDQE